jgi:hypothetical protein
MDKQNRNYYGSEVQESISYLEFGSIDIKNASKKIWAYWQDQSAYDMYMFSRYARDLLAFRALQKPEMRGGGYNLVETIKNSAHDKIADYLFKYAGLITAVNKSGQSAICENGSSLFGWIDESVAIDNVLYGGKNVPAIMKQAYFGSDISDFMNKGAQAFHSGLDMKFSLAATLSELVKDITRLKLFYGLGVSLRYSARESSDLLELARKSDLIVLNRLSVTRGNKTECYLYGSGKNSYIISLPQLIELLENNGFVSKYCTNNMQFEKDGKDTLRVSAVISKNDELVMKFIDNHNDSIEKCSAFEKIPSGEWKDLCNL